MSFKPDVAMAFISKLEKVRDMGNGRYVGCCPVHGDKNPSMSITIAKDKILTHCHSMKCPHDEILNAVNMKFTDFYDDSWHASRRASTTGRFKPLKEVGHSELDKMVLKLAQADIEAGRQLSIEDQARVELAMERLGDG